MTTKYVEVERKKGRLRRLIVLGAILALVVLAVMYLKCGHGIGMGGGEGVGVKSGSGSGSSASAAPDAQVAPGADAASPPCSVRVDASGVSVDGKPANVAAAIDACRKAGAADVLVTGDARQGTWDELHAALVAADIRITLRGVTAPAAPDAAP